MSAQGIHLRTARFDLDLGIAARMLKCLKGIEVTSFSCYRPGLCRVHDVTLRGCAEAFLAHRLLDVSNIPPGRKRHTFDGMVWVDRKRGGMLEANFHLDNRDPLSDSHPLAPLCPSRIDRIPEFGREEMSSALKAHSAQQTAFCFSEHIIDMLAPRGGFAVHPDDLAELGRLASEFRERYVAAAMAAQLVPALPVVRHLELVVDNTRAPA